MKLPAFVVDASVVLKWVVAEDQSDQAAKLLEASLAAPALIEAECSNALWAKARRGEMTPSEARRRSEFLMKAPIRLVPDVEPHRVRARLGVSARPNGL